MGWVHVFLFPSCPSTNGLCAFRGPRNKVKVERELAVVYTIQDILDLLCSINKQTCAHTVRLRLSSPPFMRSQFKLHGSIRTDPSSRAQHHLDTEDDCLLEGIRPVMVSLLLYHGMDAWIWGVGLCSLPAPLFVATYVAVYELLRRPYLTRSVAGGHWRPEESVRDNNRQRPE